MCPLIRSHAVKEDLPVHFWLGLLGHLLLLGKPLVLIICPLLEMSKNLIIFLLGQSSVV
jgi:hypothetical protein